jgi:hypothetical protein
VPIESEPAPRLATLDGLVEDGVVRIRALRVARRMMEMDRERLELQITPAHTDVVEARGDLVVLTAPPDEGFVEAIHVQQIALPVRLVAATNRALSHAFPEQHPAQGQVADRVAAATDAGRKESQIHTSIAQHARGRIGFRQKPYALYE